MILYIGIALYYDIGNISEIATKINFLILPSVLAPITVTILLLTYRFHRLIRALNLSIPIRKSIVIYLLGLSFAPTPIGSGQILRSQIIRKEFNFAFSQTSPIFLFEKWCELASALVILIILAFVNILLASVPIIIVGSGLALLFFGLVKKRGLFFSFFEKIAAKIERLKKFEQSVDISRKSLNILFSKRTIMEGFTITLPAQILQAFSVFLALQAFGLNTDLVSSTQIFYTSLIAGILSFIPGGLGITEASMIALLTNSYLGYDLSLVAASVIFIRLITFWYPTFIGGIAGLIKYRGFFMSRQQK